MLALMPQPPPLPDLYAASSTMSLAVLPSSPVTYGGQSTLSTTLLPPTGPPSKRPKLTLNTASVAPVFGKNATSLRLETLSATSPTARNTFRNAHHPLKKNGARATKPQLTPIATNVQSNDDPFTPIEQPTNETNDNEQPRPSSATSTSSISSTDTTTQSEAPYKLSFNTCSILSNGPIPRTRTRRMSFAQTRPLFPTPKKVLFRAPLTEEIKTTVYTLTHSDILEALSPAAPAPEHDRSDATVEDHVQSVESANETSVEQEDVVHSPRTGEKRDSSDEEDDDEDDGGASCPATPVAGRRKRHRLWRWTLGPVSPSSAASPVSPVKRRFEEDLTAEEVGGVVESTAALI